MTAKNSLFTPSTFERRNRNVLFVLFQLQSKHSTLGWLIYQGFFPMSSLALVLLRIKVRHEKRLPGWSIKRFMISRVGIYGVTFAIFSACVVILCIFRTRPFATHSNDKQHTEESQSVAFIPFRVQRQFS